MPRFGMGGAEKSLLSLLHILDAQKDVQVDLLLFKHEGELLELLPASVHVITPEESLRIAYSKFSLKNCKNLRTTAITFLRPVATALCRLAHRKGNRQMQLRWKYAYRHLIAPWHKKYDYACGFLDGETIYYVVDKMCADKKYGWCQNEYDAMGFDAASDRYYYEKLDKVISLPDRCLENLAKNFPEQAEKMVPISPATIPEQVRNCAQAPCDPAFAGFQGCKLLSMGRFVEQKGFDFAIEAASIMKKAGFTFKWCIMGDGPLRENFEQQIAQLDVADCVYLPGIFVNPYPWAKHADIFVQPSRFEGKSVILMECKMLALPTVATDYATVRDQLTDGENGVIVPMNAKALAKGIMDLAKDENTQAKMRENLSRTTFDDHLVKTAYAKLFELPMDTQ